MKYLRYCFFFFSVVQAQTFQSVVQRLEQTPVNQRQRLIERYLNSKGAAPIIEHDTVVHFVLYGNADTVFVNGNLQRWLDPVRLEKLSCGKYTLFYKTFFVPSDARLDYQLIIDGKYRTDPQNPNITPSGYGPHSEIRMPNFIPSPYLTRRSNVAHGSMDSLVASFIIPSPLHRYLPAPRSIKIYLPPGYDTLSHLAVVYIHDGIDMINFAMVPTMIDNLIAENRIPPILAVFVPPVDRDGEYLGSKRDQYVHYLSDVLVPMVDQLYRTEQSSLKRAMMGISNGGHISLYTTFSRPDVFQMVAGQSSAMMPWLTDLTKKQFHANRISPQMKIYLDCGRYDIIEEDALFGKFDVLEMNRSFSNLLSSLRIPHYFKEFNDGHEWANWRERMPEILIYFFGNHL